MLTNTKYTSFSVATYGSKQQAWMAVRRAVRSYQNAGYSTSYMYSDQQKAFLFGYSYSNAVAYKVPARVLGTRLDARA